MGLLLDSNPLSEETTAAAVGGNGGEKGAPQARTANGRLVETDYQYANGPTEDAAAGNPGRNPGNGPRNGEIAPGGAPATGTDIRRNGSTNNNCSSSSISIDKSRSGTNINVNSSSSNNNNVTGGQEIKMRGVEVSADNVWEAFLATRPSLSIEDRARYDSAYRKFRGGSRPADFNPISSVDDGTLRTALK